MKVVILAGGRGTRLQDETRSLPKPLVQIGGRPILWHVMRHYSRFGLREFVIALGYGGDAIKRYFETALRLEGDLRLDFSLGTLERGQGIDWQVDLVETGDTAGTAERLRALRPRLTEPFHLTWADGLSDVDIHALTAFHESHGRLATVTAVRPPPRFGELELEGDRVVRFREKPTDTDHRINGAFFVLDPAALDAIDEGDRAWERGPMERLAARGDLMAFRHDGFWRCMDSPRDRHDLEELWARPDCPWR